MISDSLVELPSDRVRHLVAKIQKLLKVASLLGYPYSEDIIPSIVEEIYQLDDLNNGSTEIISKRFTFSQKNKYEISFSHDTLQFTFQCIIDQDEKERLHLVIGLKLLKQSNDVSKHQAAGHLNLSGRYLTRGIVDCVKLARTNLGASKYCKFRAAFRDSIYFLQVGLILLNHSREKCLVNFGSSFEMMESLVKTEFITGNPKEQWILK